MATVPVWVPVFVGLLTGLFALLGSFGGAWVVNWRQVQIARTEREGRRDERAEQFRERERQRHEEAFAGLLTAAGSLTRAVTQRPSGAELSARLAAIDDAISIVKLRVPVLTEVLPGIPALAQRLITVCQSGANEQVVQTATSEFEDAVRALREPMQADLDAFS